ncbi:MAG: lipid-A-disaccharide synthase [Magnetococcales bacterium]|nr:lipid-A-disaccharide synthase [Magnetococcales bacterium]
MKLLLVAGEASGDVLGADLLAGLRQRFPDLLALGVGGPQMRRQGLQSPYDVNDLSVIGLVEVVRRLPRLYRVFRYLLTLLREEKPDLLVTIDLPDFNLVLAGRAKRLGIPVIHYVTPQVWAWRRGRVELIARLMDHLLVLFPFEPQYYAGTGLPVTFVGHPLVKRLRGQRSREEVRRELGVASGQPLLVVLPGSRRSEVARLLPLMLQTCQQMARVLPQCRFVLAQAETLSRESLDLHWPPSVPRDVMIRQGMTHDLLLAADAALVASGTATLEAALLATPMVVVYRVNWFTYEVGRRVIRVPFISLANLVAGYGVVVERIQGEANPDRLAADLLPLLADPQANRQMRDNLSIVGTLLAPPERGAVEIVGDFLHQQIRKKTRQLHLKNQVL